MRRSRTSGINGARRTYSSRFNGGHSAHRIPANCRPTLKRRLMELDSLEKLRCWVLAAGSMSRWPWPRGPVQD